MTEATTVPADESLEEPQEPAVFKMPRPSIGQAVLYYPRGVIAPRNRLMAYVTKVSDRNVELVYSGIKAEGVHHVDDPKWQENNFTRQNGVWEFTERDLKLDRMLEEIEGVRDRLIDLEIEVGVEPKQ